VRVVAVEVPPVVAVEEGKDRVDAGGAKTMQCCMFKSGGSFGRKDDKISCQPEPAISGDQGKAYTYAFNPQCVGVLSRPLFSGTRPPVSIYFLL
jgi:hypothetical protein